MLKNIKQIIKKNHIIYLILLNIRNYYYKKIKTPKFNIRHKNKFYNNIESNLKYLFPTTENNFINFAAKRKEYSTIIQNKETQIETISKLLMNAGSDIAEEYASSMMEFNNDFFGFYKILFNFINKSKQTIIIKNKKFLVNFNLWNEEYVDFFIEYTLPSLQLDKVVYRKNIALCFF